MENGKGLGTNFRKSYGTAELTAPLDATSGIWRDACPHSDVENGIGYPPVCLDCGEVLDAGYYPVLL